MKTILEIQGIWKQYAIGGRRQGYASLRDSLTGLLRSKEEKTNFWALKDVSFEVEQGTCLGIIGKNGSGKSTLLKILSQITPPTKGQIKVRGRVASLLEVGTGFHPELTGRENVYFNGSILGLKRAEIERQFDAIVDFSGVEDFLETPLKHYSSGMQLRLAFAVAAHLEPEVLLIDEVLAVGDAAFQKKCIGKISEVSQQGQTTLFVSHDLNAVRSLCPNAVLLDKGEVQLYADCKTVIDRYQEDIIANNYEWKIGEDAERFQNRFFTPTRFAVVDEQEALIMRPAEASERVGVLIEGEVLETDEALCVGIAVYDAQQRLLFWSYQTDKKEADWIRLGKGRHRLLVWLPPHLLNEGEYVLELISSLHFKQWLTRPTMNAPQISLTIKGGLSESPYWMRARPGLLAPILDFEKRSL